MWALLLALEARSRIPRRFAQLVLSACAVPTDLIEVWRTDLNCKCAALLALLAIPSQAFAQEGGGLGLDLSDEGEKKDAKDAENKDDAAPKSDATSATTPPPAPTKPPPAVSLGEKEITQEDRVKSVQRKVYLKRGRFELTPLFFMSVNDPFNTRYGFSARAAFYLADTLAIAARGSLISSLRQDDEVIAKKVLNSDVLKSIPQWSVMADVEWSPIYGKVAFLNSILHFDAYVIGGLGLVRTQASTLVGRSIPIGADLGIGGRFVAKDFLAVTVSLINTTFVDQPSGTTKGATQNLMTLNAGLSLFLPMRSTGREAE
jgi:outer membrane beta-barrel protein